MLVNCVKKEIKEVKNDGNRPAFLDYLEGAPKLKLRDGDDTDPTKCGDLREYFEYDRDYPDDERICNEVKDLKVRRGGKELSVFLSCIFFKLTNSVHSASLTFQTWMDSQLECQEPMQ